MTIIQYVDHEGKSSRPPTVIRGFIIIPVIGIARTLPSDVDTGAITELRAYEVKRITVNVQHQLETRLPMWVKIEYINAKNDLPIQTDTYIGRNIVQYKVQYK